MLTSPKDEPNKVYILGARRVGKTSVIKSLVGKPFSKTSPSTLGIAPSLLQLSKKIVTLKDLTDSEAFKYTNHFKNEIEDVKAVIIVFSLSMPSSFDYAKSLIQFILDAITDNYMPIILCGNKSPSFPPSLSKPTALISKEEVLVHIQSIRNCSYVEISCQTGENKRVIKDQLETIEDDDQRNSHRELEKPDKGTRSCLIF